jgi:hypothetical protein
VNSFLVFVSNLVNNTIQLAYCQQEVEFILCKYDNVEETDKVKLAFDNAGLVGCPRCLFELILHDFAPFVIELLKKQQFEYIGAFVVLWCCW